MTASSAAGSAGSITLRALRWTGRRLRGEVVKRVGGPARARVIFLLGAVLALNGADNATVGAVAPQLEHALHIGNTKIGLLSSVALLVGAVFTIPVGFLVDRIRRIPMLSISIVLWSLASLASTFSANYSSLLLTRLVLGAVTATAGPAIASLTGDFFPARERGRVYAYILGGEIAGTAVGFIISGSVASLISWRIAFLLLAIPGFFLARELYRTVPEPLRGGQSRIAAGEVDLKQAVAESHARAAAQEAAPGGTDRERATREGERAAPEGGRTGPEAGPAGPEGGPAGPEGGPVGSEGRRVAPEDAAAPEGDELAQEAARRLGIQPDPRLVLHEDPRAMSLWRSVRYILSIPTNMLMIISSSLGYFFFSGLSTFALLFVRGHYHASQATAELVLGLLVAGAMVGTLVSGRLSDALLRRGFLEVRVWIPSLCYLGAAGLLIPGIVATRLTPALWFDVGGAMLLSAANPPLDAARLDIMPAGLWGRAESTRTVLRSLAQALAPLVFGGLSQAIAGIFPKQAPIGTHPGVVSPSAARGLEVAFLVLLVTLAAAGVFLLRARHTYPRDVATAAASHQGSQ